ncbi:MAG: L,D-transpeptidase [Legionellaceae bacterium]|nr:L,D-transpeptidase [Legionellaceae bacterium]
MKNLLVFTSLLLFSSTMFANKYYGTALCAYAQYDCVKLQRNQSWASLFPDETQRDVVQRLNRSYNHLWAGKTIVVPKNLEYLTALDVAPFPLRIDPEGEKQIIVDQDKLAWGAYDEHGKLVRWGPISSGTNKCSDSNQSCLTITGIFRIFSKENQHCTSGVYPLGRGGAKMPYCMYFHKGFALHGSHDLPGRRASHGCVRMFTEDAKWLNEHFVELSNESNQHLGTKVVVKPVTM